MSQLLVVKKTATRGIEGVVMDPKLENFLKVIMYTVQSYMHEMWLGGGGGGGGSKMRQIKARLRNSLTDGKLSQLMKIAIESPEKHGKRF